MCSECLKTPCDYRCPNATPPKALHDCPYCKEGIIAGDKMVCINGDYYHLECLEDMDIEELMELLDLDVEEAADYD